MNKFEVIKAVMTDINLLGENLRQGSMTNRDAWNSLDRMWNSLYDVASELKKEDS